jgi:hypothetical protein
VVWVLIFLCLHVKTLQHCTIVGSLTNCLFLYTISIRSCRYIRQYRNWATSSTTGVRLPAGEGSGFFFVTASRPTLRPTPSPIQWVPGDLSPGIKQPGYEAHRSPKYNAEIMNACGAIPPSPNMSSVRGA